MTVMTSDTVSPSEALRSVDDWLLTAPDGALVGGYSDTLDHQPGVTYYATRDELRGAVLDLLGRICSTVPTGGVDEQIEHEAQHAEAALRAGFGEVWWGLGSWPDEKPGYHLWQVMIQVMKPPRPLRKLAIASVIAAPMALSGSDLRFLRELGYAGAADVAARIPAFNRSHGTGLVMPASVLEGVEHS